MPFCHVALCYAKDSTNFAICVLCCITHSQPRHHHLCKTCTHTISHKHRNLALYISSQPLDNVLFVVCLYVGFYHVHICEWFFHIFCHLFCFLRPLCSLCDVSHSLNVELFALSLVFRLSLLLLVILDVLQYYDAVICCEMLCCVAQACFPSWIQSLPPCSPSTVTL